MQVGMVRKGLYEEITHQLSFKHKQNLAEHMVEAGHSSLQAHFSGIMNMEIHNKHHVVWRILKASSSVRQRIEERKSWRSRQTFLPPLNLPCKI